MKMKNEFIAGVKFILDFVYSKIHSIIYLQVNSI